MSLRLYLDEDVDTLLATYLAADGYDVLTTQEAGRAAQGIPDDDQLSFATAERSSLTTRRTSVG